MFAQVLTQWSIPNTQENGEMRPLKMLKDMVDGTAHRYRKP